jgi:hypothetical protein
MVQGLVEVLLKMIVRSMASPGSIFILSDSSLLKAAAPAEGDVVHILFVLRPSQVTVMLAAIAGFASKVMQEIANKPFIK